MNLGDYLNKSVKIVLSTDGFYYVGKVIDADEDSITLNDKNGDQVTISKSIIATIKEIIL